MRIGVDTGGTFTDCVVLEGSEIRILKVFSTPNDAARAILAGVRQLAGKQPPALLEIIHGTTLGTNSLLERRGARVALITTAGFEDLIEIGRQARPRLFDLNVRREPPLVSRGRRFGVKERTAADGKVLLRPSPAELRRLARQVKRSRAESLALCFLFSFANPANERTVAQALRGLGLPISVSHEILPEFREYERLSTPIINAYLVPRMGTYLAQLERRAGEGFCGPPAPQLPAPNKVERGGKPLPCPSTQGRVYVMQSSGGITTAARAAREPVRTILSGPAGGVVAAAWLAERLRVPRALSFDMGGTSTDVCLIEGRPRTTRETTLGGLPVAVPVLDVHSVGAGGGSLARLDAGGALRVGPESADAAPGPICYGRGGTQPTVTDAHLLLGRLDADHFLGGTFQLDVDAAEKYFHEFLRHQPRESGAGSSAFQTPLDLARGIVAVSNANMEKALRVISVERGHDPRDYALICFGGAGGLHAADLARSLGLARVIVPPNPGAFSALGILLSDIVKDVSQSVLLPVPEAARKSRRNTSAFFEMLQRRFKHLERVGRGELEREHFPVPLARVERRLDLRYVGQAYELSLPFTAEFPRQFHHEHEKAYGYAHAGRPLEIVNLRLRLVIPTAKPPRRRHPPKIASHPRRAIVKQKPVWFGERFWKTPCYDRQRLESGTRFAGPAIVVEYSSTTVVPPDFICRVDEFLNLVLSPHAR
jgi:N-methylhydantoinase A